jgi:uncharacterized protein (UPF0332 family)
MITAQDLFRLAGRLAAAPAADEAQLRTAISRAYYSAFHLTKAYLGRLGLRVSHNHGELQRLLAGSGHARAEIAGQRLTELHSFRIKADYDLANSTVGTQSQARECVELTADIHAILTEIDTETNRQVVRSGIEAYQRKVRRE